MLRLGTPNLLAIVAAVALDSYQNVFVCLTCLTVISGCCDEFVLVRLQAIGTKRGGCLQPAGLLICEDQHSLVWPGASFVFSSGCGTDHTWLDHTNDTTVFRDCVAAFRAANTAHQITITHAIIILRVGSPCRLSSSFAQTPSTLRSRFSPRLRDPLNHRFRGGPERPAANLRKSEDCCAHHLTNCTLSFHPYQYRLCALQRTQKSGRLP